MKSTKSSKFPGCSGAIIWSMWLLIRLGHCCPSILLTVDANSARGSCTRSVPCLRRWLHTNSCRDTPRLDRRRFVQIERVPNSRLVSPAWSVGHKRMMNGAFRSVWVSTFSTETRTNLGLLATLEWNFGLRSRNSLRQIVVDVHVLLNDSSGFWKFWTSSVSYWSSRMAWIVVRLTPKINVCYSMSRISSFLFRNRILWKGVCFSSTHIFFLQI